MGTDAPKAVGILQGSGGMYLGFKAAGFETIGALEANTGYGATFRLNRPELPHFASEAEWDEAAQEFASQEPVLVYGHPPCQGLTGANRQAGPDNPKNRYFKAFFETGIKMRPMFLVAENIPRMLGLGRKHVEAVQELCRDEGYELTIHRHMVSDFGVSQLRRRVMFVAERKDSMIRWPSDPEEPAPTIREAISDLASVFPHEKDDDNPDEPQRLDYADPPANEYQERMREGSSGVWNHRLIGVDPKWETLPPGKPWFRHPDPSIFSDKERERVEKGNLYHSVELYRLHPDRIGPVFTGARNKMHPWLTRRVTVREGARIMGFPDRWVWRSNTDLQQIAAGVCPPAAEWFGKVLMAHLAGTEMPAPEWRLF